MFGHEESAQHLAKELLAGNVAYIKREEVARVLGLIDDAKQPSEDLRSGAQFPIQASANRLVPASADEGRFPSAGSSKQ